MSQEHDRGNDWRKEWESSLTYVSYDAARSFLNAHGFSTQTRPTFIKLEENYALPYQEIQTGRNRPKRQYSKKGLEDFVRNPQKYLILNEEGICDYLDSHGFPCKDIEDFENWKKKYAIPCIIRNPNKPKEKIYTIKELEKFIKNPEQYAIRRKDYHENEKAKLSSYLEK